MMTSVVVGILSLALAVLVQRLALAGRGRSLRRDQQAFTFHAIRDDLQLMSLEGFVRQDDPIYQFLYWSTNLGIRNAGTLSVREAVRTAKQIEACMPSGEMKPTWSEFSRQLAQRPEPVRRAAAQVFGALAWMMVSNDWLVRAGLTFAMTAAGANRFLRPMLLWIRHAVDRVASRVAPDRARVVRQARDYHDFGDRLGGACP